MKDAGIVVEPLSSRQVTATFELTGTLLPHPNGEGFVGTLVEGRVKEVFADIGDRVAQGQPLCTIESPTVGAGEAEYITTLADLQFVKSELDRQRTLVSEGIGAMKDQLELEARLAAVTSAVSAAERTLHAYGFTVEDIQAFQTVPHTGGIVTLRSPIAGTVTNRDVRVGMRVAPDTDLFHIVDLKRLRVQVDVPEIRAGDLVTGKEVTVISHNGHKVESKGRVERVGGSIEQSTRTVKAFAVVENSAGLLRPGAFVTVRIEPKGSDNERLAVPVEALFKDKHGDYLLYLEKAVGNFIPAEVETGATVGGWVEILSGVPAGTRVVIRGAFAIKSQAEKSMFGDGHNH